MAVNTPSPEAPPTLDHVLAALRAAAEPTRLRLLALCAEAELTVSELTGILGQSQPRVSRHLKMLCDAGLLERHQERTWVFYRLVRRGPMAETAAAVIGMLPDQDEIRRLDRMRLDMVRTERARQAEKYFAENAQHWDQVRTLYVAETEIEEALVRLLTAQPSRDFLDIGTGTARVLDLLAPYIEQGVGLDSSHAMLAVARVNLEQAGHDHCQVRHGDMYALPFPNHSFDLICFHMVLHYADHPEAALAEASRVLRPGGRLVAVDFAPHDLDYLRTEHAHRRLGFADSEVRGWFAGAGLDMVESVRLPGDPLTVRLWAGRRRDHAQDRIAAAAASAPAGPSEHTTASDPKTETVA